MLRCAPLVLLAVACDCDDGSLRAADGDGASVADAAGDGAVVPDACALCASSDDCSGDRCCAKEGCCAAWGGQACGDFDESCEVLSGSLGGLEPERVCAWDSVGVRGAPVVAPIDEDAVADIAFVATDGRLRAIGGATCELIFESLENDLSPDATPAAGDIDGDGAVEIVALAGAWGEAGPLRIYRADGSILVESENALPGFAGAPALANVDGGGVVEVIFGAGVFRYVPESASLLEVWNFGIAGAGAAGAMSVVADVDLDGRPDVVTANAIIDAEYGIAKTPAAMAALSNGYVAVANVDAETPEPEIVVCGAPTWPAAGEARVHSVAGDVVFGPIALVDGGPPAVADFDGDGALEFACAQRDALDLFDPGDGPGDAPRWERATSDGAFAVSGVSAFDFDGDGAAEVVHADGCWLRILDGATGETREATVRSWGGGTALPVVADLDGNGAEIVVGTEVAGFCNGDPEEDTQTPFEAKTNGIVVLRGAGNRWLPAQRIWNQHSFHLTNVLDSGAVPGDEEASWDAGGTYRGARAGEPVLIGGADLTLATPDEESTLLCPDLVTLRAIVRNRGAAAAPSGVTVAFFSGDERLCETATTSPLPPGGEEAVACAWIAPGATRAVVGRVNDDERAVRECKGGNNTVELGRIGCE
ncbi:MAG: FG-GAP-like repeat-containing protein [Myxococcota bacterium]